MLDVNALSFSYAKAAPVMNFSLHLKAGEISAVLGASGSGKSTLLSLLAGFLPATSGSMSCYGTDFSQMAPHLRPLSVLLQKDNLFPQLTVEENIGLGLDPGLKLSKNQSDELHLIAHRLDLEMLLQKKPEVLSGGQQQRVAIARVLVRARPILLLDEPFSALDPKLKEEMLILLKMLVKERQMGVLMVTHSPEEALRVADKFLLIKKGHVILEDDIEVLSDAPKEAVRDYLGRQGL